jgi:hypothetical protein
MPVRKATPEETEALFGDGMVFFGMRSAEPGSTDGGVPSGRGGPTSDADQEAHDRWLEAQTPEQIERLASGLGNLARSKLGNHETSSTPAPSRDSGAAEVGSFTDEQLEMARALGF